MTKKTVTYYLPTMVTEFIEEEARRDNRKPSNWLANTILKQMQDRAVADGQD